MKRYRKIQRFTAIIVGAALFLLCSSCTQTAGNETLKSLIAHIDWDSVPESEREILSKVNNNDSTDHLITQTYDLSYIIKNNGSYFSSKGHSGHTPFFSTISECYDIECLRYIGEDKTYIVLNVTEGGRYFLFFTGFMLDYTVYVKEPLNAEDFDTLKPGSKLSEVMDLDPSLSVGAQNGGQEETLLTNSPSIPTDDLYSIHLFPDRLLKITYEKSDDSIRDSTIKQIEWLPDFVLHVYVTTVKDGKEYGIIGNGDYEYRILPQDYPS